MPFLHMLPDVGMNYTFNRPLLDGASRARLKELSAIAPVLRIMILGTRFGLRSPKRRRPRSGTWTPPLTSPFLLPGFWAKTGGRPPPLTAPDKIIKLFCFNRLGH
jgi:hypothetical protein